MTASTALQFTHLDDNDKQESTSPIRNLQEFTQVRETERSAAQSLVDDASVSAETRFWSNDTYGGGGKTSIRDADKSNQLEPRQLASSFLPHSTVPFPVESAIVIQDWEGCVVEVSEENFSARLLDRTRKLPVETELAEIPIEQVDDGDRELVREGAIFYLTIRRRILQNGRHENSSQLVFRRMPGWHASTLRRAREEAEELARFFE